MKPAQTIGELFRTAVPHFPLQPGDERYVGDVEGREEGNTEIGRMLANLRNYIAYEDSETGFAKFIFTGQRGSGKTTELLRMREKIGAEANVIHLEMEESLKNDFDYTLMLLWIAEETLSAFQSDPAYQGVTVRETLVDPVANWFVQETQIKIDSETTSGEASLETSASAGASIMGFGLRTLGKLKASLASGTETRKETRESRRLNGEALVSAVNTMFAGLEQALRDAGKNDRIVVIVDNVDRLESEPAKLLFKDNSQQIGKLNVHLVLTAPPAQKMGSVRVDQQFFDYYSLPTPKLFDRNGDRHEPGWQALRRIVESRASSKLFDAQETADHLIEMSAGSFRDLIRLLSEARLNAQASESNVITMANAVSAVTKLRLSLERALAPPSLNFPILVKIAEAKQSVPIMKNEGMQTPPREWNELLDMGAVFEYNGDGSWFDVHCILKDSEHFRPPGSANE